MTEVIVLRWAPVFPQTFFYGRRRVFYNIFFKDRLSGILKKYINRFDSEMDYITEMIVLRWALFFQQFLSFFLRGAGACIYSIP